MLVSRHAVLRPPSCRPVFVCAILLLGGCAGGESGGEECPPGDPVAVVGLDGAVHMRLVEARPEQAFVRYESVEAGSVVPVDEYLLSITASVVGAESDRVGLLGGLRDRLVGTARASCAPDLARSVQRLGALDIRSDAAVSGDFPAGVSLAGIARASAEPGAALAGGSDGAEGRPFSFPPVSSEPALDEFAAGSPFAPLHFGLRLEAELDAEAEHRFTVTYALANGETFTLTTRPVTLAPASP